MNPSIKSLFAPAILLGMAQISILTAHSVFIEPSDTGDLMVRFAEFGSDYETSPGYLDSLDAIVIWKPAGEGKTTSLTASKFKEGFEVNATKTSQVQAQTGFPVMTRGSSPARKPHFYARWAPSLSEKGSPALTLDIVPTGQSGQVQVIFRDKPLPGVEATLYTPEANDQELKSDENGIINFESNEKGLFMLKIGRHREERRGYDRGQLFALTSHNCSLTWTQE